MTLIEILVVITIMALVAGAVGASVFGALRDAKAKRARTDASSLSAAALRFRLDHARCPTSTDELVEAGYLQRHGRSADPWDGDFVHECEADDVIAVSAGPDGVFGTEDDVRP
ncbi:MAG: type II secretion system protein GspG [Myxococcota bacterium]|jgi:general secretion pathway protein G|nr:type II secretion system protein GspG [Myxococcota bacterium]